MRISYSGLDAFQTCPAKFKYQYIDKIKTPKNKEAVFGTLIHECLRLFHQPADTAPLSEDDLLKIYTDKWDSSPYDSKQDEAFAFHQGVAILKNYYQANANQSFIIVNLETPFSITISDKNSDHQITGRIDRIDKTKNGSFEVIDYKTSKKMPAQAEVDQNFQLSVYYLGLISRWPKLKQENRPITLSLYFLKHGEKLSAVRDNSSISETEQRILDIVKQIEKSNYEPRQNPLCDWCQYQRYCPLYKHKYKKPEQLTADDEQIKTIIAEFFAIKDRQSTDTKRIAELKSEINRYCDDNNIDRVFSDERYITRNNQQRFEYDFEQVKQILEPLGKWENILAINNAKFNKVIKSLPYPAQKQIEQTKKLLKEFKVISVSKK